MPGPRPTCLLVLVLVAVTACTGGNQGGGEGGGGGGGGGQPPSDEFDERIASAIEDLEAFWVANYPELSTTTTYTSPMDVVAYEPGTLPEGTGCGRNVEDPSRLIDKAFQSLADRPGISMQRELQADCYAGVYAADALDADLRDVVFHFCSSGDERYSEETWFDRGVHGPAHERALATGSGILTEDPSYCANYVEYQPRDPLALGTFTLYVPAALEAVATSNELTRIVGPHANAYGRGA